MRSYQTDRWKLVRFYRQRRPDEFNDRLHDPEERTNLWESPDPEVQQAIHDLDRKMASMMQRIGDTVVAE